MVREIDSPDLARAEPRWTEIQAALERVAELSTANISSHDFHAALVEQAVTALGAIAGAAWLHSADGTLQAPPNGNSPRSGSTIRPRPARRTGSLSKRSTHGVSRPYGRPANRQIQRRAAPTRRPSSWCFRR